jgi:hypothetical protein
MTPPPKRLIAFRAVAEFVVIVIGVLVAFAVDDWATEQENRGEEIQYLEQLATELTRDSAVFTGFLGGIAAVEPMLQSLHGVASGASPFPSDTAALLRRLSSGGLGASRLGTRAAFDELLSTGSLRLISSANLRSSIVGYYSDKDLAERTGSTAQTDYAAFINNFILQSPSGIGSRTSRADETGLSALLGQAPGFMRTPGFDAAIVGQQNYLRRLRVALEILLEQDRELIGAIELELRRLR